MHFLRGGKLGRTERRRIFSGGRDGTVRVWSARSLALVQTIEGVPSPLEAMAAAPDGRWLAAAGRDGVVRAFDRASGAPLWSGE